MNLGGLGQRGQDLHESDKIPPWRRQDGHERLPFYHHLQSCWQKENAESWAPKRVNVVGAGGERVDMRAADTWRQRLTVSGKAAGEVQEEKGGTQHKQPTPHQECASCLLLSNSSIRKFIGKYSRGSLNWSLGPGWIHPARTAGLWSCWRGLWSLAKPDMGITYRCELGWSPWKTFCL